MERRLNQVIGERFQSLRTELAKESKQRFDILENLKNCLENDFPKLNEEIKLEIYQRDQQDLAIQDKVSQELEEVRAQIQDENRTREHNSQDTEQILRQKVNDLAEDLETEKNDRITNEEALIRTLDQSFAPNQQMMK